MIIKTALITVSMLLSCICSIATWNSQSQDTKERDQVPVYRVQTDLAEIRAVVTDRKGHFVEGLNRDDFELIEDGKLQEISHFSISRIGNGLNQPDSLRVAVPDKAAGQKGVQEQVDDSPQRTTILFVE